MWSAWDRQSSAKSRPWRPSTGAVLLLATLGAGCQGSADTTEAFVQAGPAPPPMGGAPGSAPMPSGGGEPVSPADVDGDPGSPAGPGPASPGSGDGDSGATGDAVAGDGDGDGDGAVPDASMATEPELRGTGPGDWGPGDYPPNLEELTFLEITGVPGQRDLARQYKVHVPPSYDPELPTPLVFCIHGLGQNAMLFCLNGTQMPALSDDKGFILVMPNGYQSSWNGGECCGAASAERLDDVALIRAIFDEVSQHLNVDLNRVFATGLSNGAFLSYRLACEAADLFAAVAPNAGLIGINGQSFGTNIGASDLTVCEPSQPISVFDTHGTTDPLVPYMLKPNTLDLLQAKNGCDSQPTAASEPASTGDTTCVTYENCDDGVELTACSVEGGGHCWFGSPDCGTGAGPIGMAFVGNNSDTLMNNEAVWRFFERNPRTTRP